MNRQQRRAQASQASSLSGRGSPGVEPMFTQAVQRHQAGDLREAKRLYLRVLAVDRNHHDALHLLGVVAGQARQHERAAELMGRAIRLKPDYAVAHGNLGAVLRALGRGEEAIVSYGRAIALEPDDPTTHYNLGVAFQDMGRVDEAIRAFDRAISLKPDHADAYYNLGVIFQQQARHAESIAANRRAIEAKPDYAEAHNNLGVSLGDTGSEAEALAAFHRALALKPDYPEALNNLGLALQKLERHDEAIAAYQQALILKPDYVLASVNLAVAFQELGRMDEALAAVSQALTIDPASPRAWYTYCDLVKLGPRAPEIETMTAVLATAERRRLSVDDRIALEFALAKAWMDAGDSDAWFAHLQVANRLKRASVSYDVGADIQLFAEMAETFTAETMSQRAGAGALSDRPVFVVGMPRSGTTLIEQILASHPDVHGGGELATLERCIAAASAADHIRRADTAHLTALGNSYVDQISRLGPPSRRLVNKTPANFRLAGLIHLMLPNARIIHCRRDPIDTCLSCYSKNFAGQLAFTGDLRELGLYYRAYDMLMAHWRALLPPDRFLEVHYEDVVEDLEKQARRLTAFLGLDWDDACLSFHKTSRPVRTASFAQVRQPIYSASVGRWKAHAVHLAPLIEALGMG